MPRPVKWSRDVHAIRERAQRSKTETWSRQNIEQLFEISRPSAQNLMKAIGEVQVVGGTHFIDRGSLLAFLEEMVGAESVEAAMQYRLAAAGPVIKPKALSIRLPAELRRATLDDLTSNIEIKPGEVRVTGTSMMQVLEGLLLLATVMQNDLDTVEAELEPPPPPREDFDVDEGLREMLRDLRRRPRQS